MPTIGVLGTLDTKGPEHLFVAEQIRAQGIDALLIDMGTGQPPTVEPDLTRDALVRLAESDLGYVASAEQYGSNALSGEDRGVAMAAMSLAVKYGVLQLFKQNRIDGLISLGGGGGTSMATGAMRGLPIGFPKVMVSTLAGSNTVAYVGTKDIVMFPSVLDVSGLNRVSRRLFAQAVAAVCGMVQVKEVGDDTKPLIVASMFGNTTDCVESAKKQLEAAGFEVLVFHATGTGGRAMEMLIASGMVSGVLDITTTELADELLGGILSAGSERLTAAAKHGVPAVVVPGCLDMCNFGPLASVPEVYQDRMLYEHNPDITLLRTNSTECRELGKRLAERCSSGGADRTAILLPTKAISVVSAADQPFHLPEADAALFDAIREHAKVPVHQFELSINDPQFAEHCVRQLLELIGS